MIKATRGLTDSQALKKIQQLLAKIQASATRFPDDPQAQRERIQRAKMDRMFFFKTYLPHWFSSDFADMHYQLSELSDEPGQAIVRFPRGFAKTTIGAQGIPLHNAVFDKVKFQLVIGKNQDHAAEILLPVILELEANERLAQDFGDLTTDIWGFKNGFMLSNGCWLACEGWEGRIRGIKKGAYRPNYIVVDDIEDRELVRNPRRVKQMVEWWLSEVMFALHDEAGTAMWLCTSLSGKSPTSLLLDPAYSPHEGNDPPDFKRLSFKAENPDGGSAWPARFPKERLQAMQDRMGTRAYKQEMLHEPMGDGGMFRREWFREILEEAIPREELATVTATDPSVKENESSDRKAVVTVSKHLPTGNYYIRHAWIRAASDTDMVDAMYLQQRLYRPMVQRLETQGAFELLKYPLREGAKRHGGLQLPVRTLTQSRPKILRIRIIEPIAERGKIWYVKDQSDQNVLLDQLELYPSTSVKDDGCDALAMCLDYLEPLSMGRDEGSYESMGKRETAGLGKLI